QSILPLNVANIVKMCLATGQAKLHMDTNICGRVISWSFFPVVANQVVHCYAEDVTDRVNLEADLRQAQKMESVGQLAAGVAHDFNNLLTIIQGHSGLLSEAPSLATDLTESVRQITFAAERAANLTRQLLMFSRKQVMQPQLLNLNEVIHNLTKVIRTLVGAQITFERSLMDELPPIHADPGMMEQILVNLSVNARDAMPRGGTLTIATRFAPVDPAYVKSHAEATPGNYVRLTVTDTGHGMDRSTISRIFEPFFTTKEIGKGTGLGLSTVYGIVKQHQGWIEVDSEVGKGASFSVYVPVATRAEPRRTTTRVDTVPGGNETILVVEDEEALRELVSDILQRKGYTVLEAQSGDQAMQVWQSEKERIDLLLTDMMMPGGLSGRDVAERLLADRPELKVIYTSGYSIDTVTPEALGQDAMNFLQKPYDPETLAQMVRNILNGVPAGT
ncbi:MAG TPA: response regulator, partial [Verrucomicrobiae bacterium]|nr:response regulator [Verrucomicrobiae bacterium]